MPTPLAERVVDTADAAETRALAARLAAVACPGDLVALLGDLGAGKTEFAKGFGAGLGVTEMISSPSFVLMAEHQGRVPLFHLDLYRLDGPDVVLADGLLDEREADGVTLVEWADRLGRALPAARLDVRIEVLPDERRRISVRATDARFSRYPEALG
ncbi:MAG: tRNA (adenosine(37)-N6)-threonylcarbamoyltransferase complex ATPase subunit type 1 TsaE [Chloroflexota bacterium]